MSQNTKAQLMAIMEGLITEGSNSSYDNQSLARFLAGCKHLAAVLGDHGKPWAEILMANPVGDNGGLVPRGLAVRLVARMVGTIQAIQRAVGLDWLFHIEDLIRAETFDDLLEQAGYLAENGYHVAAAVLGRAVLEEHLRNWCQRASLTPQKAKPTVNDYNQSLYGSQAIDKIKMKHVESMATIGNDAAHGQPVNEQDVKRLLRDVREFLQQSPI